MKYYDENRNGYYNPDDGQDSNLPGENANWRAIQAGFAASAAKDSQQDTDVATAASAAEAARRTADQALEAAQAAGGDITDLEAAVQAAQQTADSAGTAAAAAQTAAGNATTAAQSAAATASSALAAAQAAQAAAGTPTSIGGNLEMYTEANNTIPANRTYFMWCTRGTATTFGSPENPGGSPVPDGIYQLPPAGTRGGITAFLPNDPPVSLGVVSMCASALSGYGYSSERVGISVTGGDGTVTGRVCFAVQSNNLSTDVVIPQGTRVLIQTDFARTSYPS